MIKVLNITSDTNIGGAGRCILCFLKYYDRSRFQAAVALPKNSKLIPEIKKLDTEVIEISGLNDKSLDLKAVWELRHVIKEWDPAIVHTHGAMSGRIAAKLSGRKIIYTRHSVFPVSRFLAHNPGKWINGRMNEFLSTRILAVAEAAKENLVLSGISPGKIEVILNGVEEQAPLTEEEIRTEKENHGIGDGEFVIGILARMEEVKGHIYLLEAADILKKQGRTIRVLIAGTGALEEQLRQKHIAMELEETVVFLGFVKDVRRILGIMDLQINASFGTEATSLSLLEGMSMGLPAVVSDYGGNPGVIKDGENGLIFQARDSQGLACAIARVMDDSSLHDKMRRKSREIFEETFTVATYVNNIQAIYEQIGKSI